MIRAAVALALLATAVSAATAQSTIPPAAHSCAPSDGLNYICGPTASEDLAHVPGTRWLVASGMNVGEPAQLYLIDTRTQRASIFFPMDKQQMQPDATLRTGCTGPPNLDKMSTDGISIRAGSDRQHLLYVANHGDRHAIEIFRIDAREPVPKAAWISCVPMPPGTLANAVVPLADGGLVVSSFYDPGDKDAWARMSRGENTGSLWEWHAVSGMRRLEVGGISGANGVEISADGNTLYASAWSGRELLVLDRRTGVQHRIALDFLPDNIKRAPDGTLFVGGQRSSAARIAACTGPDCPQDWIIARVDPLSGKVTPLVTRPGNALINYACGAVQADDTLYITVRGDRRLIYLPLASLPSLR
jgi:hypothetical protein